MYPYSKYTTLNTGGRLLDLSAPKIMGILNITPDSFYDGGRHNTVHAAVLQARKMQLEGVDILDIGAYSTRPGSGNISIDEELSRLIPVIRALNDAFDGQIPLSIDTFRAEVAQAAITAGGHIINDISGGTFDKDMFSTVAKLNVPYILMHNNGSPETMHQTSFRKNIIQDITLYFGERLATLEALGVKDIILDPGPGFGKTIAQNFSLLKHIDAFHIFGRPILGAVSRKSLIYKTLGTDAQAALNGTTALNALMLSKGVQLLRVHDVKAARETITLLQQPKI